MNRKLSLLLLILIVILALAAILSNSRLVTAQAGGSVALAAPQETVGTAASTTLSTGFTYQGRLTDVGSLANGDYDFRFQLFDAATGGAQVGSTVASGDVPVSEGLFTVLLDFGEVFDGTALWLAIGVRPGAETGDYTPLSPRQPLTAAPYALYARRAPWSGLTGIPAGFADGVDNNSGGDITAVNAGTGLTGGGTNGSVTLNANASWLDNRYWGLTGNSGTTPTTNFLGTTDNQALELHVNGGRALRLEPNATSPNLIGGNSNNDVTGGVVGATISGGGSVDWPNLVTADYATVGGGSSNEATALYATVGGGRYNDATDVYATVGGGWSNDATGDYTTVSGGINNAASGDFATVGGGENNTASGDYATIGGGELNAASGYYAATVGGGYNNAASGYYAATVGGGENNAASGYYATVGGGINNAASGYATTVGGGRNNAASGYVSTVGGGVYNTAIDDYATVGGGYNNDASGYYATVVGGASNEASGYGATVGGGSTNTATGDYSFAAGHQAQANLNGCFVWADATNEDFPCSYDNQFRVRANGGATFLVDSSPAWQWVRFRVTGGHLIDTSTDAHLTTGGVWTNGSDQAAKENFAPVDGQEVLAQLAAVPIQTWNYRAEDPAVHRMGPTAQDFYAAFGLGEDELHIATIDADGVALAAIQALYQRSQVLEAENAALQGQLADLEARLAALEQAGGNSRTSGANLFGGWPLVGAMGLLAAAVVVSRRRFPGGGR